MVQADAWADSDHATTVLYSSGPVAATHRSKPSTSFLVARSPKVKSVRQKLNERHAWNEKNAGGDRSDARARAKRDGEREKEIYRRVKERATERQRGRVIGWREGQQIPTTHASPRVAHRPAQTSLSS